MSLPSRMFGILGGGGGSGTPAELDTIYTKTLTDNAQTLIETMSPAIKKTAWIFYAVTRGAAYKSGVLIVAGDGTDDAIAEYGVNEIGTTGVVFSTDSAGGMINLYADLTNTGVDAEIKYRMMQIAP